MWRIAKIAITKPPRRSTRSVSISAPPKSSAQLEEKFPNSERADEYRFLRGWCSLCNVLTESESNLGETLDKFDEFLKNHKEDFSREKYAHDPGQKLLEVVKGFADRNANPTSEEPLQDVKRIGQVRKTVEGLGPEALSRSEGAEIEAALGKVRTAVALWLERQKILTQLRTKENEKPIQAIKRAEIVLQNKEKESPGFRKDREVLAEMAKLYDEHFASVVYKPRREAPPPGGPERPEDEDESLTFVPLIGGARETRTTTIRFSWPWLAESCTPSSEATANSNGRSASASIPPSCRIGFPKRRAAASACW